MDERIALMRPQIIRLGADICCFQEVHGQERPGQPRALLALRRLLEGTNLDGANLASTKPHDNDVYDERNIVVATHHAVVQREQLMNNLVDEPLYKRLTALPPDATAQPIGIERPVLHVKVDVGPFVLHASITPRGRILRCPGIPPCAPARLLCRAAMGIPSPVR